MKKNKYDKVAYVMLNIAAIVMLLLLIGIIGIGIYTTVQARDSEGGGWALFIMMLMGILIVPLMLVWGAQCIMHLIGWIQYRKNNVIASRVLGMANSCMGLLVNLVMFAFSVAVYGNEAPLEFLVLLLGFFGIGVIYAIINIIILIAAMRCKEGTVPH